MAQSKIRDLLASDADVDKVTEAAESAKNAGINGVPTFILGGVAAAPLAGYVTKIAPARLLLGAAAVLVIGLSIWQGIQLWPRLLEYPIFNEMAQQTGLR